MRRKEFIYCLVLMFFGCSIKDSEPFAEGYDIAIMSFNIRYDNPNDEDNRWDYRKEACVDMWTELQPDIVGIQEAQQQQLDYLKEHLSAYECVGELNEDSQWGEYKSVFYNKTRFNLIEHQTFWLSETPDVPSLGWDANNIRIVTWVKLYDLNKSDTIYVFNTHFDHKGKVAREKSSELLLQKINEIVPDGSPIFITGDFNMLIGSSKFDPITSNFLNTREQAEVSDNNRSFNGWGRWYMKRNIDFIFYKNSEALAYKTVVKDFGVPYISDHYPIIGYYSWAN